MKTSDHTWGSQYGDVALLILRLQLGILMLTHGFPKLMNYSERMDKFADPFGLGPAASLALVIFAEFFCSILLIVGFKVRLAVIPLIITMLVVIFYAHWDDPFGRKELPLMYISGYVILLLIGGGKYSLDTMFKRRS